MRSKSKKGFTIVELVIVIAVIAILAAVLIPTFSSLLKKANQSADQQAVHQMNVALAAEEAFGAPGDIAAALAVLEKAGLNGENYQPLTADTSFYWNKKLNRVVIADGENQVSYPEEYARQFEGVTVEETKDGDCAWFNLVRPAGKYSVTYTVDNSKYVVRFYEDRTDNGSSSNPRYTYRAVAHTSEQYENGSVVTFWTDADEGTGMITFTVTTTDAADTYSFGILNSNKMGITIGAAPQSQTAAYQAPDGTTISLGTYTKYNPGNKEYQGLREHITLVMEAPHKISWTLPSDGIFLLNMLIRAPWTGYNTDKLRIMSIQTSHTQRARNHAMSARGWRFTATDLMSPLQASNPLRTRSGARFLPGNIRRRRQSVLIIKRTRFISSLCRRMT